MSEFKDNNLGCAVILPSLNPTEKLDEVISGLREAGFAGIVVVDDGSDAEHQGPFSAAGSIDGCVVLRHERNMGKGAALKTAFRYLEDSMPEISGAVTADGDGQHLPKDILRCAEALKEHPDSLVLGVRDFSTPDVPTKSRLGNRITSFVFRTCCGIKLGDTQTGLRAMSRRLFPTLLEIKGERYEYETNMLLELNGARVPFCEVEIETVYEDNNSCSHFRPVRDSIRIYGLILKYAASSIGSCVIDLFVFWLAHKLLGASLGEFAPSVCTFIARAISSFVNFNVNKKLVFGSKRGYGSAMLRYYILCVIQTCVSAGALSLLNWLLGDESSGMLTLLKFAVDTVLFFISFRIQRGWVFRPELQTDDNAGSESH